jgi:hypothetical protein
MGTVEIMCGDSRVRQTRRDSLLRGAARLAGRSLLLWSFPLLFFGLEELEGDFFPEDGVLFVVEDAVGVFLKLEFNVAEVW